MTLLEDILQHQSTTLKGLLHCQVSNIGQITEMLQDIYSGVYDIQVTENVLDNGATTPCMVKYSIAYDDYALKFAFSLEPRGLFLLITKIEQF